jgi:hypothetical protein
LANKFLITTPSSEFSQVGHVSDPFINGPNFIADQFCELRIATINPSSGGNTIGLVLNLSREHLIEVLEDRFLKQLGVKSGHTVDSV